MNCKHCGGTVSIDKSGGVIRCPYCNSVETIPGDLNDRDKMDAEREPGRKRWVKASLSLAVIFGVLALVRFSGAAHLGGFVRWFSSIIALLQTALFSLSYLYGIRILRGGEHMHLITAAAGIVLLIPSVILI